MSQYRAAGGHFAGYEKLFVNHLNGIFSSRVGKWNEKLQGEGNKSKRNMFSRENVYRWNRGLSGWWEGEGNFFVGNK